MQPVSKAISVWQKHALAKSFKIVILTSSNEFQIPIFIKMPNRTLILHVCVADSQKPSHHNMCK